MKKHLSFIIPVILFIGVFIFAQPAKASMTVLTDNQISEVVGQGGIAISADQLGFDVSIDTVSYGDHDGLGQNTQAGYLSLNGVSMLGSVEWDSPMSVEIGTVNNSPGNIGITSIHLSMSDTRLHIDHFLINSICLGSQPSTGSSLGSFGLYNMTAQMTGTIEIYSH